MCARVADAFETGERAGSRRGVTRGADSSARRTAHRSRRNSCEIYDRAIYARTVAKARIMRAHCLANYSTSTCTLYAFACPILCFFVSPLCSSTRTASADNKFPFRVHKPREHRPKLTTTARCALHMYVHTISSTHKAFCDVRPLARFLYLSSS